MTVKDLENLIRRAASIYYAGEWEGVKYDNPIMSDAQFDQYVAWLRSIAPDSPVLQKTGWGYDPNTVPGDKVHHTAGTMDSIDRKPRAYKDIPEALTSNVRISAKLDGLSAKIEIENGKFVRMSTRGNGVDGIDRTDKFECIMNRCGGVSFPEDFNGEIRGELIISRENWNKLAATSTYSHARNAASGIINANDILNTIKFVDFVPYKIVKCSKLYNLDQQRELISSGMAGFPAVPQVCTGSYSSDDLVNYFAQWGGEWNIDGVVITSQNITQETEGVYSYNECAFKFESLKKQTTVKDISWQMGKTNKLTPVLILDPIEVDGANVQHVTAHNAANVQSLGIKPGSVVEIMRSGGVIPFLCDVVSNPNTDYQAIPEKCPQCNCDLSWRGVDIVCDNPECGNVNYQALKVWIHNIAMVDGIADLSIFQYLHRFNIDSIDSFYAADKSKFEGISSESVMASKFEKLVDKMYNAPVKLNKALQALNITRMGEITCKKLAENSGFVSVMQSLESNCDADTLVRLSEVIRSVCGDATADKFNEEKSKFNFIKYLLGGRIVYPDLSNKHMADAIPVCITGKLSMPRKAFEKLLVNNGYVVKEDVTKKTKYLITNDLSGTSGKHKRADELGTTKISEDEMKALLR